MPKLESELINIGIDAIFKESLLPVKPEQIMEDQTLWKDHQWVKWPARNRGNSNAKHFDAVEMECFIKDIEEAAGRVDSTLMESKRGRSWASGFVDKIVRDEKDELKIPDLVLLDKRVNSKDATWKDVISVMNVVDVRPHRPEERKLDGLSAKYAEQIFKLQPGRRFVLTILVVKDKFRFEIFDRTGPLHCSEEPNIHCSIYYDVVQAILGTLFLDLQELGFDASVYDKKESGIEGTFMTVDNVEYQIETIYHEKEMYGRGTVCYKGVSQVDGSIVVIKDQWTNFTTGNREMEILEHLNKGEESSVCTPDGVRVIPKIISGHIVTFKTTNIVYRTNDEGEEEEVVEMKTVLDTTKYFRLRSTNKKKLLSHWRLVMAPFASKIQMFPSLEGFVTIFKDIVHAIRIAHSKGVLHRDISHRNILWYAHEGLPRGLLIDYDGAVFIHEKRESTGCGTLRYMALNRLTEPRIYPASYCEDLESLFYVMCFLTTTYDGPCDTQTVFPLGGVQLDDLDTANWSDCNGKPLEVYYDFKLNSMKNCEERVFGHIAPFFEMFKICLRRYHKLVFGPDNYIVKAWNEQYKSTLLIMQTQVRAWGGYEDEKLQRRMNEQLRIWDRPDPLVFDSLLETFDDMLAELERLDTAKKETAEETQVQETLVDEKAQVGDRSPATPEPLETEPSPQALLRREEVPLSPNRRKRKVSENDELEPLVSKRIKATAVPLQPSIAANVLVIESKQLKDKHFDSKEFAQDEDHATDKPTGG
ncbi:hypothetical protein SCHPADRAFT_936029 [Schizopora paradoxa]|uniref:Protein kinase domain-containing protein n=1 Tax=Schizopora paradoxa TaxID=27342 RepID=A0A0H2S2J3_9AGAM|nr:hypothetical protein SCHPADRAFT_936029 [Schizopora paradoxa]